MFQNFRRESQVKFCSYLVCLATRKVWLWCIWTPASANRVILEAQRFDHVGFKEIPAVNDHTIGEFFLDCLEIRAAKFLPLGNDHKRIAPFQRNIR
jgi:hypothetical protein